MLPAVDASEWRKEAPRLSSCFAGTRGHPEVLMSLRSRLPHAALLLSGVLCFSVSARVTQEEPSEPVGEVHRELVLELFQSLRDYHLELEGFPARRLQRWCLQRARGMVEEDPAWLERCAMEPNLLRGGRLRVTLRRLFRKEPDLAAEIQRERRALMQEAMLDSLADPFTSLIEGDNAVDFTLKNAFPHDSGVMIREDEDGLYFALIVRNSDADFKGIRVGDRIERVDDIPADEITLRRAQERLDRLGAVVEVRRDGWDRSIRVPLRTMGLAQLRVRSTLAADNVGYVEFPIFAGFAFFARAEARRQIRAGAKALILDLRGNPGGLVADGGALADLFLEPGATIARFEGRYDSPPEDWGLEAMVAQSKPFFPPELPLILLVDESSASASEMVAHALKSNKRAMLVGRQTFGKFVAQVGIPLVGITSSVVESDLAIEWDEGLEIELDEHGEPAVDVIGSSGDDGKSSVDEELVEGSELGGGVGGRYATPDDELARGIEEAMHFLTEIPVVMAFVTVARFMGEDGEDLGGVGVAPNLRSELLDISASQFARHVELVEDGALMQALSEFECSEDELGTLRNTSELPLRLAELLTAHGYDADDDTTRAAGAGLARRWLQGRHPELLACPEHDPDLAKALQVARLRIR